MSNRRPIKRATDTSAFLGIGSGKKAKREAEARVKVIEAEAAAEAARQKAERDTLLLQLEAAKQGYTPEADAAAAVVEQTKAEALPETTLYLVLGGIVLVVMLALYFILRKK